MSFSSRNGYKNVLCLEEASNTLIRRIFAYFYKEEYDVNDFDSMFNPKETTGIEDMMIEMGITYDFPYNRVIKTRNAEKLKSYLINNECWYAIFDFIEAYVNLLDADKEKQNKVVKEINRILESELSPYRVVDKSVVPITSELELNSLNMSMNTRFDSVNKHFSKALSLFADRRNPDYENSIKESISAVEAMCCIITGDDGRTSTLGKTIKKLKDHGVYIHGSMEAAYSALYGYTSDEDGIRHGGIDFKNVPAEDAKYMLISCSAFVNYLIEKYSKVK